MYPNPLEDREAVITATPGKPAQPVEVLATVFDNGNGRAVFVCLVRDLKNGVLKTIDADKLTVNDRATANLG